jgi:hypothetical protein
MAMRAFLDSILAEVGKALELPRRWWKWVDGSVEGKYMHEEEEEEEEE